MTSSRSLPSLLAVFKAVRKDSALRPLVSVVDAHSAKSSRNWLAITRRFTTFTLFSSSTSSASSSSSASSFKGAAPPWSAPARPPGGPAPAGALSSPPEVPGGGPDDGALSVVVSSFSLVGGGPASSAAGRLRTMDTTRRRQSGRSFVGLLAPPVGHTGWPSLERVLVVRPRRRAILGEPDGQMPFESSCGPRDGRLREREGRSEDAWWWWESWGRVALVSSNGAIHCPSSECV